MAKGPMILGRTANYYGCPKNAKKKTGRSVELLRHEGYSDVDIEKIAATLEKVGWEFGPTPNDAQLTEFVTVSYDGQFYTASEHDPTKWRVGDTIRIGFTISDGYRPVRLDPAGSGVGEKSFLQAGWMASRASFDRGYVQGTIYESGQYEITIAMIDRLGRQSTTTLLIEVE